MFSLRSGNRRVVSNLQFGNLITNIASSGIVCSGTGLVATRHNYMFWKNIGVVPVRCVTDGGVFFWGNRHLRVGENLEGSAATDGGWATSAMVRAASFELNRR